MITKRKLKNKLLSRVTLHKETGCWIFNETSNFKYGRFTLNNKHYLAHRAAYLIYKGEMPQDFDVDHFYCNNNFCCNPGHLEAVTHAENIRRAADSGTYRGEKNRNARHSNKTVREIKELDRAGIPKKEIAKIFDVPYSTVCGYTRGQSRAYE